MSMMAVVFDTFLALASGMDGEGTVPHRVAEDLLTLDLEHQEAPAAAKVVGR